MNKLLVVAATALLLAGCESVGISQPAPHISQSTLDWKTIHQSSPNTPN